MVGSGAGSGSVQIITYPDLEAQKTYGSGSETLVEEISIAEHF